jgi:hypothetical protein
MSDWEVPMKNSMSKKIFRHTQAVFRIAEIKLWARIRLLESFSARKALWFMG